MDSSESSPKSDLNSLKSSAISETPGSVSKAAIYNANLKIGRVPAGQLCSLNNVDICIDLKQAND